MKCEAETGPWEVVGHMVPGLWELCSDRGPLPKTHWPGRSVLSSHLSVNAEGQAV